MTSSTHVINLNRSKLNQSELLAWCTQHFGEVIRVHGPTLAELHRVCYDNSVHGVVVFYFKEEADYFFFLLRWQ